MNGTLDNIIDLGPNEVFVFGSNGIGAHRGGAAKLANEKFGYPMGVSTGLIGQAYGIDTMGRKDKMIEDINAFLATVKAMPAVTFYLTKIGCGIAGYPESEVTPLFKEDIKNLIKPKGW